MLRIPIVLIFLLLNLPVHAQDKVFSGPQAGEKITPFKVLDITGPQAGKETDYITQYQGAPTVVVFLHGLERSMLPLVRVVDEYTALKKSQLKTVFVSLSEDRVASEQRLPLVQQSIRLQSPLTLSLDGAEGPGNYGLNKRCLITLLVAKDNKVTANFALVQPGIADAPKVLAEIGKVIGDNEPPKAEDLEARRQARNGGGRMERPNANAGGRPMPLDVSRFDLTTEKGLREAVTALLTEVQALRREVTELRGQSGQPNRPADRPAGRGQDLPGAAPTDTKLIGMLRAFIQPSNNPETVDRVLQEVEAYVKGNADLTKQAVDGWVRVLHLKYGTDYAQKTGKEFVEKLKK